MRILLDENLDWRLRRLLPGHEVDSVSYIGWSGIKNGVLLRKAADTGYEVLLTMDGNLPYQQDLSVHGIAVIALRAPTNRLADTTPLMPAVLAGLPIARKGKVTYIG
jgi:predicted nuclease of predicted toxin-antitoxin system